MTTPDLPALASKLTKAQREAIIRCVDALSELAGEGFGDAEEAIYDLFNAFDGDPDLEYETWIRTHLERTPHEQG